MTQPHRAGPLSGIRVIDLTRVLAGPFCTMVLGDFGADVLKIEDCESGDQTRAYAPFVAGLSHYFLSVNRNKRSCALNLKKPEAVELLLRLISEADILVENFRPGVLESLGLSEEVLRRFNPQLITCSISGFGQTGSMRNAPAFDILTQALSGVMSINGPEGSDPLRLGIPLGDIGGGLWALIGILGALQHRNTTGEGLHIDISLLDGLMSLLGYLSQLYFLTGTSPKAVGNGHHTISPYGCYEARDGSIVLAAINQRFYENFCAATRRGDLLSDARFRTSELRSVNKDELEGIVRGIMKTRSRRDWVELFGKFDVPCSEVKSVGEALQQQVVHDRRVIEHLNHKDIGPLRVLNNPVRFVGRFDAERHAPPPDHGEHTSETLHGIGIRDDEIDRLEGLGIVKRWSRN